MKKRETIVIIILILLLEVFFFRNIIFSDALMGDNGDSRFINLILEHWFKVLCGDVRVSEVLNFNMFYPVEGTLAYSDLLIGFVPLYSFLRSISIDMYSAAKWTMILIHLLGAISTFFLLNKIFDLNKVSSIVGTVIFMYSNNQNIIGHPQMFVVYFVPFFLVFFMKFYERLISGGKGILSYGIAAILIFSLIFYTAGYVGYFLFIFMFILVFFTYVHNVCTKKISVQYTLRYLIEYKTIFLTFVAIIAICFLPYIYIYIPTSIRFGKRTWEEILWYLPTLTDIVNIPDNNLFFGGVFDLGYGVHAYEELRIGFPLITAILCGFAFTYIIKNQKDKNYKLIFSNVIAILFVAIMIIKIDDTRSLWWYVYMGLPGIGSLRVVNRFWHFLSLPIGITIAFYLEDRKIRNIVFYWGLIVLVVFQYVWVGGVKSLWGSSEALSKLESVSAPPSDCEIMYITKDERNENEHFTISQLDGIEIANKFALKAINGYSSFYPHDWQDLNDMFDDSYEVNMYSWIKKNNLKNVYAYHYESNQWSKVDGFPVTELVSSETLSRGAMYINGEIVMVENSLVFGPYFNLSHGKYKIEVRGENIMLPLIYSSSNKGQNSIELDRITVSENIMEFEFVLSEFSKDWEFIIENNTKDIVKINSIKLSCVEEY